MLLASSLLFLVIIVVMTQRVSWKSLRWRERQRQVANMGADSFDLLRDSPLTGLGLGCWALTYWGTTVSGE